MLNRLEHSCSYPKLEEIETALCIEKIQNTSSQYSLPSGIHPCVPTVLAFGNIDRVAETLSGAVTSHCVNGIVVQIKVGEFRATHEEANTRIMIHAGHAAAKYPKVVVISEDADVFVILLRLNS